MAVLSCELSLVDGVAGHNAAIFDNDFTALLVELASAEEHIVSLVAAVENHDPLVPAKKRGVGELVDFSTHHAPIFLGENLDDGPVQLCVVGYGFFGSYK